METREAAERGADLAHTYLRDGGEENLSGVSLLQFGAGGLVIEQRDIWCRD